MSDQNLEIKIDLKLDDDKAQSQMQQALKEMKDFASNKANNIDIKINVDKSGLADLAKIENAVKEINKLSKESQKALFSNMGNENSQKKLAMEQQKALRQQSKEQEKLIQQQQKERENMYKGMFDSISKQESEQKKLKQQQIKEQEQMYKEMFDNVARQEAEQQKIKQQQSREQQKLAQQEAKEQEKMYKQMFDNIAKEEARQQKFAQQNRNNQFKSIGKDMASAQSQIAKLGKSGFVDITELDKVKASLNAIADIHVWENLDNLDLTQSRGEIDKVLEALRQLDDVRLEGLQGAKVENFSSKMIGELDKLESRFKELGKSTEGIDRLRAELAGLDSVAPDRLPTTFQRIRQEVSQLNGELRTTNSQARGMGGFFTDLGDSLRTFTLGNMIGDGIASSIRNITKSFLEMDEAMTNVKKVAQETDIDSNLELDKIKFQAVDIAKEVGMATKDVINGIADSLQAGMGSMEQSIAVARSSLMLANVGDMAQSQASSAINTMVKGFKIDPLKQVTKEMNGTVVKTNELTEAMDLLNFAGNNYAVGTDGVAEALKRGGSVLSEYGVSLSDTVALITSANEAVQNPEKVGNGMKSIAINLAGVKASAKDGTLELNKTSKALSELAGIDVYSDKSKGEIKDMVTILDEVQKKWKDLDEDKRLAISEAIAGKQQAMIFQSLMGNFKTFDKMRKEFANNEHIGSAEAENERYVDSLNGKLNHLRETWVSIAQTMVSSDFTKGLLDGAIKASEAIDWLVKSLDKVGALTPTLVAVGSTFGKMAKTMMMNGKNGVSLLTPRATSGIFSTLKNDIRTATNSTQALKSVWETTYTGAYNGFANVGKSILNSVKFIGSFALQAGAIALVTLAIQAGVKAWDSWANGIENTDKKIKETITGLNASLNENQTDLKYLEDTEARYDELIAKKKEYSSIKPENLTQEQVVEMQELKDITSELVEMFPELVIGYDEAGSPILLMAGDMDKLKEKTREQIELDEKLLKIEREKQAINARKAIQKGNYGGLFGGLEKQMTTKDANFNSLYDSMLGNQQGYLKSMANGDEKWAKTQLDLHKKQKNNLKTVYEERLKQYQEYTQKEKEIQLLAFDEIQAKKGYSTLGEKETGNIQTFIDSLNWGGLDDKQYQTWINSSDKLIKLAQEGSPKLEKWNKDLARINDTYAETEDVEKYEKSLKSVAKTISEDLNIPYETVFAGLQNIVEPLEPAERALQDFLKTFNLTRKDLLGGNKMDIAQGLKEQFDAINSAVETLADRENSFNANGTLKYDIGVKLANKDSLPKQVRSMIDELSKEGFSEEETKLVLDVFTTLQKGDTDEAKKMIDDINKRLKELGKDEFKIDIKTLFDPSNLDNLESQLERIRTANKNGETIDFKIMVDGVDKAQLYQQIIEKIDATPQMTNKLILEHGDALKDIQTYDEFVQWLKKNPKIVTEYEIKGINELKEAEKTQKKMDGKKTESKHTAKTEGVKEAKETVEELDETIETADGKGAINVKANEENILKTIEDIETLVKLSAKVEDGKYKLSVDADTQKAVESLGKLEEALGKFSNKLKEIPNTSISIDTAQGAKNLSGLLTRISQVKDALSKIGSKNININTAQSAKNLSGLITRVDQYTSAINKVLSKDVNINTAQSAKNLSGLIRKIGEYNETAGKIKPVNISSNVKTVTANISTLIKKINSIPTSKTVTVTAKDKTKGSSIFSLGSKGLPQASEMLTRGIAPVSETPEIANSVFSSRAITSKTPIANKGYDIADSIKYTVNLLQELENRVQMVTNSLTTLDKKMENAVGNEKIKYLQEQIKLYEEQKQIHKELEDTLMRQSNYYKYVLQNKGFKFTSDGNLTNYEEKLIAMEKALADKESQLQSANDKASNEKNEKKKESLEKKAKELQDAYDKEKNQLEDVKTYLDEYIQVTMKDLPDARNEWLELNNQILANKEAIEDAKQEQIEFNREVKNLYQDSVFVSMIKQVNQYKNSLEQLDKLMENAFGKEKEKLMNEQIELLKKQEHQLNRVKNEYTRLQGNLQKELEGYGFEFRDNGDIVNYIQHITKLKESGNKDFEHISKIAEEYLDILVNQVPSLEGELIDLNNKLFETQWALQELSREQALFAKANQLRQLELAYDRIGNKLELIDIQLKHAYGKDKLNLIQSQIDLLEEQSNVQETMIKTHKAMMETYKHDLVKFGVEFTAEGDVSNLSEVLNKYKDDKNFEKINSLLEEYIKLQAEELPDAVKEWENLNSAIKDAYKEQLEITKDIEDEITEVYRKQLEERKKLIDEELKKRVDAINKEKEAYNKSREEAKYQNDYSEQLEKVKNLEKQIEIAKKDTSLAGQKKLQDLLKQLADENKAFQDMVQQKIDDQVNDMFDSESDRLTEEADKAKEELDNQFSDSKIQELVKEALSTGVFEDIDGTMRSLQDVMLQFVDEYGEGLGATGDIIKNELIANLEIAKQAMQDLVNIKRELGLSEFAYGSDALSRASKSVPNGRSVANSSPVINFNEPLINVEGNVDRDVVSELRELSKEIEENVVSNIVQYIR